MLTFTGIHITQGYGAPSIRDIAVQSMRVARFGGCGRLVWPIGMHMLFVADIVVEILKQPKMEHFALLHDAAECSGISDICRPMKVPEQRELEHRVMNRIYRSLGLRAPKDVENLIVKKADDMACNAEGASDYGPRGYAETQSGYQYNAAVAGLLASYMAKFKMEDASNADGIWAVEYERRTRAAIRKAQSAPEAFSNAA